MAIACISPIDNIENLKDYLESFSEVFYIDNPDKSIVKEFIQNNKCDTIFVNPNKLNFKIDEFLLTGIKKVCTASTGTNHIDVKYCEENDIQIISLTKDLDTINKISSTAEHAFALMMSLIRNIPSSFDSVKKYQWDYQLFIGRQINQLKIGVVGFGRLGKMFAHYAKSFGAEVFVTDPYEKSDDYKFVDLKSLFQICNVISIHVHLNEETNNMINKDIISKPIYLINTSRGSIVNENDIIELLDDNKIYGYATDVLEDELGNIQNSKLIEKSKTVNNLIITPHIGGMTSDAQKIAYFRVAEVLKNATA